MGIQKISDEKYQGTDNLEIMSEAVHYNNFLEKLILRNFREGDRVLDFGAGAGTFAEKVKKNGVVNIQCLEPDIDLSKCIAQKGMPVCNHLDQIDDVSIDYLYTLNVLEHIANDVLALKEIYKKMKENGKIFIYVPAFQRLYSSMDRKVGHYRRYTRQGLRSLVEEAGFNVESVSYADSLGFFAALLYKQIGGDSGEINLKALITYDRVVFPISRFLDIFFNRVLGKNVMLLGTKKVS